MERRLSKYTYYWTVLFFILMINDQVIIVMFFFLFYCFPLSIFFFKQNLEPIMNNLIFKY